jgi:phosphopantothenoylcysteine synthetase/decarboxylase
MVYAPGPKPLTDGIAVRFPRFLIVLMHPGGFTPGNLGSGPLQAPERMETDMKLKTRLMLFTAAAALSANMAFAAINPQTLADSYIAEGYTYVEVKVGPTQTKLEAVKGDRMVEVVYDNATGDVINSEFQAADDDYVGRTGVEIDTSDKDFSDDDGSDDESVDDDSDDDEGDDDSSDDGEGDDD